MSKLVTNMNNIAINIYIFFVLYSVMAVTSAQAVDVTSTGKQTLKRHFLLFMQLFVFYRNLGYFVS
jgi:hypothetical protein